MSRHNNKAATQAETTDLVVSALSEAANSSSSSAPIHATRGASAALLAKEITHYSQPVATSSTGLGFRSFSPMASQSVPHAPAAVEVPQINCGPRRHDVAGSYRRNAATGSKVTAIHAANEHSIFLASHAANVLL